MPRKKALGLAMALVFCLGCSEEKAPQEPKSMMVKSLNHSSSFMAGERIELEFQQTGTKALPMLIENAVGSVLLEGKLEQGIAKYNIPDIYSQKAGPCHWKLLSGSIEKLRGVFTIKASKNESGILEAYMGPPSLIAGESDFSMLVALPVDEYDNPIKTGSQLKLQVQSGTAVVRDCILTKNLLGWKRIPSQKQAGSLVLGATTVQSRSKELNATIYPAKAVDFNIKAELTHRFADGNQIVRFRTESLKDSYGNDIADGTLIQFDVKTSDGDLLNSWAVTSGGVAIAKLLHPEQAEQWSITAYIPGIAKSNTLVLNFEAALSDFDFGISPDGDLITVGPLESFLDQLIPDGMHIELKILKAGDKLKTFATNSRNGMGFFELDRVDLEPGEYELEISVGGVHKTNKWQYNE